ncbi:FHA domain-containing protein [Mycena venus]|uniref:FHA domain-containing protein n=1 Tax=Mycena venus TaxID=2733690 RepID=A0A8H6YQQ0_9AGAR|nr:FHA domain-containing protein [Mycena venus]
MDTPGRFGTIELLRQKSPNTPGEDVVVIASFGVDTPTVSFGRDPTCSVRLYYPAVAPLHARIVFNEDRKAFVEVLGKSGVVVDGCMVFPLDEGNGTNGMRTVALGNASEVEIHGKRFRFTYPPKEMRAALAASPARPGNRALRLSMIASAQVFSPRPSHDPRQNLRVLQSPLRLASPASSSPRKNSAPGTPTPSPRVKGSPVHQEQDVDEDEEVETITLVQGAHPRVVEEAKDLVILEDVELSAEERARSASPHFNDSPSPNGGRGRSGSMSLGVAGMNPPLRAAPAPPPSAPRTPRRQSLHKAVLIRSAQRAVRAANSAPSSASNSGSNTPVSSNSSNSNSNSASSTPSVGGARPVVRGWEPPSPNKTTVATAQHEDSESDTDTEEEEAEVRRLGLEVLSVSSGSDVSDDDDDEDANGEQNAEEEQEGKEQEPQRGLGWRKSLERIALWPFGGGKVKKEEEEAKLPPGCNEGNDNNHQIEMMPEAETETEMVTPRRKVVGAQRTPAAARTPAFPRPVSPAKASARPPSPAKASARPPSPAKATARPPSPVKAPAQKPATPSPFGVAHPAAQTPRGFGRKSLPSSETDAQHVREDANDGVAPMDVDAEGYTPIYEDLAAYRHPQASTSNPSLHRAAAVEEKASTPPPAKAGRPLAAFMTPQPSRTGFGETVNAAAGAGGAAVPRYSLGGVAQRVRVEDSPWKVRDLLATNAHARGPGAGVRAATHPANPFTGGQGTPARRPPLSDAERRAISERRRSALTAPDDFFKGGDTGDVTCKEGRGNANADALAGEQKEEDPRRILENLRETVEGLKRRRESVEFQAQTEEKEEQEKERPLARMLRGRVGEDSGSQTQLAESEPGTTKNTTKKVSRGKSKEPEEVMDVDAPPKPARRTRKAAPTPAPEASDDEMTIDPVPASTKPARRGRKPAMEKSGTELTLAVPAAPRRGRSATPTPTSAAEDERDQDQAVDPAPAKSARRTRKPTAEPESDAELPNLPPAPTKPRRTRKATAEPESDAEPPPAPARRAALPATEPAKRRGRTGAKATPASAPERKTTTRGRSRAPEMEAEDADDADPLDSITDTPEVELVAIVPPKRRARSVKPKAVKEEEAELVLEEPARGGRAKKATTSTAVPAAPKPRSARKAAMPASAQAAVEKENAPGEESEEPVVKVRVSRSKKVKEEGQEVDVAAPALRRTRTRTRT